MLVHGYGVELKWGKVKESGDEEWKMWWRKIKNAVTQGMAWGLEVEEM